MSRAYYNEIDKNAAEWLRNLINAGLIAPGDVDERSIEDVCPNDLLGYTQCHFFAGIGVWSYALRQACWPDSRPVWTGSCPCQPFSAAGKGDGFADERHLWPAFFHLISVCQPAIVLGEQVASKDADPWIDLVHTDLEAVGYAVGAVPFPSAGIGAPHIRDRTYWVARAGGSGLDGRAARAESETRPCAGIAGGIFAGRMGDADHAGLERFGLGHQAEGGRIGALRPVAQAGESGGLADTNGGGRTEGWPRTEGGVSDADRASSREWGGPTNGFWRDADWLFCRDGKWRPVEPGTFPLAHGAAGRVGRLRAYGNAVNAVQAEEFIRALA